MQGRPDDLSLRVQGKVRQLCEFQASSLMEQDEYSLLIPPSAKETQLSNSAFDLAGAVDRFLDTAQKKSLSILGEAGTGKSFFVTSYIKHRAQAYQAGDIIPIYVSLPTLTDPENNLMREVLEPFNFDNNEIEFLRCNYKLLLVLDAYDELKLSPNLNLFKTNSLYNWNVKVIFTCRPSYFSQNENHELYFAEYNVKSRDIVRASFLELYVAPFDKRQIDAYINQYVRNRRNQLQSEINISPQLTLEWLESETYTKWIEQIPGLKDLVSQPFLLFITMQVLPKVMAEFQTCADGKDKFKMSQKRLLDHFLNSWFGREQKKIDKLKIDKANFRNDCMAFAQALATKMYKAKKCSVTFKEKSIFVEDAKHAEKERAVWAPFFSEDLVKEDDGSLQKCKYRIALRKACPLKVGDGTWAFLHDSLRDHLYGMKVASENKADEPKKSPRLLFMSKHSRPSPVPAHNRTLGEGNNRYRLMNRFSPDEAVQLLTQEKIKLSFSPEETEAKSKRVVLGGGAFGKFRIARVQTNQRFCGVKKIRDERSINYSKQEAEIQRQLIGLPNVMPIWDSMTVQSKRFTDVNILLQFMPLAGFGDGRKLLGLLQYIDDKYLIERFLIHILKSLLIGLEGMHSRKVYHLDIKPENFVMDARGYVYIIDFGTAYREYGNKKDCLITQRLGTVSYFSPERLAFARKHKLPKEIQEAHRKVLRDNEGRRLIKCGDNFYIRHAVDGDGNCGYTAFGIDRNQAYKFLIENIHVIKGIIQPIVLEAFHTNHEFISSISDTRCSELGDLYLDALATRDPRIDDIEREIIEWSNNDDIIRHYIEYDVRNRRIESGWCHPLILFALGRIRDLNIRLFEFNDEGEMIPHRHYPQFHSEEARDTIDLLFINGNHFERLELSPQNNNNLLQVMADDNKEKTSPRKKVSQIEYEKMGELADRYDGEKADVWAAALTVLKLLLQKTDIFYEEQSNAEWRIRHWNSDVFNADLHQIPGWDDTKPNTLQGLLKLLLQTDPNKRPTATEALKNEIFDNPKFSISEEELNQLMSSLIEWKISPPGEITFTMR